MATRSLEIMSVEWGYNPLMLESPKQLWVILKFPAPAGLKIGEQVRLHMAPGVGVNTRGKDSDLNSTFIVEDIVGYRVSLNSLGLQVASAEAWGHDTRTVNVRPLRQNWHYGYGDANSFLEYYHRYG